MSIIVNFKNKRFIFDEKYKFLSIKKFKKIINKVLNIDFEYELKYFGNSLNNNILLYQLSPNNIQSLNLDIDIVHYDINKLINLFITSSFISYIFFY